jgi:hypothetical protein
MATTFVWTIQDSDTMTPADVVVGGGTMGDIIEFGGATFNSSLAVGSYNTGTYVENSTGGDDTSAITARNSRWLDASNVRLNESASKDLDATTTMGVQTDDAVLTIVHSSTAASVTVMTCEFYAHQGGMITAAPVGVDFRAYEANQATPAATWTEAEGSAMTLALDAQGSAAMSHTFYLLISASPTTVGEHAGNAAATSGDFVMTISLRYT